ncbi:MAG TPA: substrate-binding domain-containing protein [Streptosporangiaceae bacterium]|nr:substrate-binding domain-containing protein [Streptosporangiaceae bacterium]
MRKRIKLSVSLAAACTTVGALMLTAGSVLPAQAAPTAKADYAPVPGDVVGDGSDTLQFIVDFGADGDPSGDTGFNDAGNLFKLVSMDATADSNSRFAYANNSTTSSPNPLSPTAVYRGGTFPVQRINGSGAGINALLADTSLADAHIDFARMSSNPTTAQGATAVTNGWQGLQQFVLGTEHLREAAANTSNSPVGLSAQQLVAIYQCTATQWTAVGGSSADHIIPIIPQSGSGTRNTFLADLQAANGGTAITLGSCVVTGEENDPVAITSLSSTTTDPNGGTCTPNCSADAIEPFSGARLNLWSGLSGNTTFGANSGVGYFHTPTAAYPGGAALSPGVHQLTGTPSDANPVYNDTRNLNIVYRWTDQISTTPWQPGSTLNWAQALFCNPGGATPFFQTAAGKTLIAEAGGDPATQSCLTTPLT